MKILSVVLLNLGVKVGDIPLHPVLLNLGAKVGDTPLHPVFSWDDLQSQIISIIGSVFALLLIYFLRRFVIFLETNLKTSINEKKERQFENVVIEAVHYAEEIARQRMKIGEKLSSTEKLNKALEYIEGKNSVMNKTPNDLIIQIEATLNRIRDART